MQTINPPNESWEPWQPRIGQRVRVRLSGECRLLPTPGTPAAEWGWEGHPAEFDGLMGVVIAPESVSDLVARPGHPHAVEFDAHVEVPGVSPLIWGADFAAIELEPLE